MLDIVWYAACCMQFVDPVCLCICWLILVRYETCCPPPPLAQYSNIILHSTCACTPHCVQRLSIVRVNSTPPGVSPCLSLSCASDGAGLNLKAGRVGRTKMAALGQVLLHCGGACSMFRPANMLVEAARWTSQHAHPIAILVVLSRGHGQQGSMPIPVLHCTLHIVVQEL